MADTDDIDHIDVVECPPHKIDSLICGGPHRWVYTDLGWELLNPTEEPQGTPCEPEEQYATPPDITGGK